MPPKFALLANSISTRLPSAFVCLQCRFHSGVYFARTNINASTNLHSRRYVGRQRAASTASTTAIDARREIPPQFQQLHASLSALKEEASIYTNSHQVQLALRGLESEDALIRVALLGINEHQGARRLTRALLVDPLQPESEWERQLLDEPDGDSRSLLIRYGENLNIDRRHPLIKTLSLPIPSLLKHKVEIFIKAISETSGLESTQVEAENFLVPSLELNTATGRIPTGNFPVHRSVIFARGLQNNSILPPNSQGQIIKGVIDASWINLQEEALSGQALTPINLALAESAIYSFRRSLDNGLEYERGWVESGLAGVSAWFLDGLDKKDKSLKLSVQQLVEMCCNSAERTIKQQELSESKRRTAIAIPIATRDSLEQDITRWAEFAHTELRNQLDVWFRGQSWKRIAWWKLFWRVDDIGAITSDVLERAWLVEAEKGTIWLFGRLEQAGLKDSEGRIRQPAVKVELPIPMAGVFPGRPLIPGLVPPPAPEEKPDNRPASFGSLPRPWPQEISRTRNALSATTIPPLQALAQSLMLETLSTTLLTSSLSALVYMSLSSPSIYEAGTIAALGLVYSLRRLQGRWGLAQDTWEAKVRDEGRSLLRDTEAQMRRMVSEGGKSSSSVDDDRAEERAAAKKVVEDVRRALQELVVQ